LKYFPKNVILCNVSLTVKEIAVKYFSFFVIFSVGVPGGALRGSRDGRRPLDGQVAFGLTAVLFEALFVLLEALRVNI
jgi:hypothetical protein